MQEESVDNEKQVDDSKQKTCFVIMPISDAVDYEIGHFKRVYEHIIKPACEGLNYKPIRADDIRSSHIIMIDVLKRILGADMAICDLGSRNPNVLYELAIRQCFDLPVALIKDNFTPEPFDVAGIRYMEYDKQLRIDRVEEAIIRVQESIRETELSQKEDVFSLIQLLGRKKAETKTTQVDPILLNILQQVNRLSNHQNTISHHSSVSYDDAFIPIEEVKYNFYPPLGTELAFGLESRLYIGSVVVHNVTGKEGVIIGYGTFQGKPVILVQVYEGPLVAANPTMYTKVSNAI